MIMVELVLNILDKKGTELIMSKLPKNNCRLLMASLFNTCQNWGAAYFTVLSEVISLLFFVFYPQAG